MKFGYWTLVIILFFSLWTIKPLLTPGFFPMHDDTQVVRVHEMGQALKDGHFPVRWVKDLGYGYGYPIFNFYAPLPYYVGGAINVLGADALASTKTMMVIGILLAGVFMYLLARQFWGELGGVVSGLFYMYAPYHALDIYVRGAVGEFWAYAFLPLLARGLYKRNIWVTALGFAGVILSHNLTAMMLIPFLLIALAIQWAASKKVASIRYQVLGIGLGLGLSAFYWLPALLELGYTNVQSQVGGGADFQNHFVCWQQLWQSPWGFGASIPGCIDGLSFKIGKLHIIISLVALIASIGFWKKSRNQSITILVASGQLLVAVLLTLEISKPIWERGYSMAFIQYPWRFLVFVSFFSSFLAGSTMRLLKSHWNGIILIFILLYFNIKLFEPQTILPRTVGNYINAENIKWETSKISDEYMPQDFQKPTNSDAIANKRVDVGKIKVDKTHDFVFLVKNNEEKKLHLNIAPFPAWRAFINGKETVITAKNNGVEVFVPQGEHEVKLSFISTPMEKLANIISIISVIILARGILKTYGSRTFHFLSFLE